MNPLQMLMSQLQTQIKAKNPQAYQQLQNLIKNQNNPEELLQELTSKYTPEQKEKFIKFANGYGVTNEQLSKYGIDAK